MSAFRMTDWQHRVAEEHRELVSKHDALVRFIGTEKFDALPRGEQHRMLRQEIAMKLYREALYERIFHFTIAV